MALIKCEECGKEISDKARNCVNCGCPIFLNSKVEKQEKNNSNTESSLVPCLSCGAEIAKNTKVCPLCGHKFDSVQQISNIVGEKGKKALKGVTAGYYIIQILFWGILTLAIIKFLVVDLIIEDILGLDIGFIVMLCALILVMLIIGGFINEKVEKKAEKNKYFGQVIGGNEKMKNWKLCPLGRNKEKIFLREESLWNGFTYMEITPEHIIDDTLEKVGDFYNANIEYKGEILLLQFNERGYNVLTAKSNNLKIKK